MILHKFVLDCYKSAYGKNYTYNDHESAELIKRELWLDEVKLFVATDTENNNNVVGTAGSIIFL